VNYRLSFGPKKSLGIALIAQGPIIARISLDFLSIKSGQFNRRHPLAHLRASGTIREMVAALDATTTYHIDTRSRKCNTGSYDAGLG